MQTLDLIKHRLTQQKPLLEKKYGINRLGVFGSYVRGDSASMSDVDILIDYETAPSLIALIELETQLSELLATKVDLVTVNGLKPQLKQKILQEVVDL